MLNDNNFYYSSYAVNKNFIYSKLYNVEDKNMRGVLIAAILFSCIIVSATIGFIFAVGSDYVSTCGNTLYVDDDGGADYVRIQDAIDNASDGDTVFVYSGTYFENLVVDKSINLIGEDKNTTVIDGRQLDDTIWIKTSSVRLSELSIVNSKPGPWGDGISVIEKRWWPESDPPILLSDIVISDCVLKNNMLGIRLTITDNVDIVNCEIYNNSGQSVYLVESSNVDVHHCIIHDNGEVFGGGIYLDDAPDREDSGCKNVKIHNNSIFYNVGSGIHLCGRSIHTNVEICYNEIYGQTTDGISISGDHIVDIHDNVIVGNGVFEPGFFWGGVRLQRCMGSVTVRRNNIAGNVPCGVHTVRSTKNVIVENNFINNSRNAFFYTDFFSFERWDGNYWDDWRGFGPKIIFGLIEKPILSPWFNFDWNPAREPYDIA
jgi:hypothetical protein